jgi:hypothetical protein
MRWVALLALTSAVARGQTAPEGTLSSAQMSELLRAYGEGETSASIPFFTTGAVGVASGAVLLGQGGKMGHGAAWPLLSVGGVEMLAGALLATRSGHFEALQAQLGRDPQAFAREERHHLYLIRDRYQPFLLSLEAAVAVAGGVMAGLGSSQQQPTLEGVGIGLALQGVALFLLDWAVLDRARAYLSALALFLPEAN